MIDRVLARYGFDRIEELFTAEGPPPEAGFPQGYPNSARQTPDGVRYRALRDDEGDWLLVLGNGRGKGEIPESLSGESRREGNRRLLAAPQDHENAQGLLKIFPGLAPGTAGPKRSSFGVGDRLGIASPGHIPLFVNRDVVPVLAQQSLRELELLGRSFTDVIESALWAVFNTGYRGTWIADGDHLKETAAVESALRQGCTMITADLSDHLTSVPADVEGPDAARRRELAERYPPQLRLREGPVLRFDSETLARIALTYGRALDQAVELFEAGRKVRDTFDFEISIDETDLPTTPEAHYFVARELKRRGVEFTSIAPRFVGEFQKGIDYIGDIDAFAASFEVHAAVAAELGYKISIHSSSDKFSVYPVIGRLAKGACHLKTSGTNWLTALETVAREAPEFFRGVFARAYEVFPAARTYYHITPDMGLATSLAGLPDTELGSVFANPTDRQVMHVSYGELFKDAELKARFFAILRRSAAEYWAALEAHIGRHLDLLST